MPGLRNANATYSTLERIAIESAEVAVRGLDAAFAQKIASPEYRWPGPTVRRNGQTVRSPRDIIDTGRLDASQQLRRVSPTEWEWLWNPTSSDGFAYALLVHEGATLTNGTEYPARPWTARAVNEYQPGQIFEQEVGKRV